MMRVVTWTRTGCCTYCPRKRFRAWRQRSSSTISVPSELTAVFFSHLFIVILTLSLFAGRRSLIETVIESSKATDSSQVNYRLSDNNHFDLC